MLQDILRAARFSGDDSLLGELREIPAIQRGLSSAEAIRKRESHRAELLASTVRLSPRMLPDLAATLSRLSAVFGDLGRIEGYVFPHHAINAFVSRDDSTTIVALSSAAIQLLHGQELDFVIGHELGHARFGHLEIFVEHLLSTCALGPRDAMRLRAWQRAAEISADRAGLCVCGSLEAAACAFFKVLSGLDIPAGSFDWQEFASQWDALRDEVALGGERSHWQLSHPFPPLRMKAMMLFWDVWDRRDSVDIVQLTEGVDHEVERMLAMMDPRGAKERKGISDPVLASYFFWGGLYIALADGRLVPEEVERLQSVAPPGLDVHQVVSAASFTPTTCMDEFRAGVRARRRKLTSVELYKIVEGLIDVAAADGTIDRDEIGRLYEIGRVLGIKPSACDLIVSRHMNGAS